MIGFVFSPRPKKTGREVLSDIVIEPKVPKPLLDRSWWCDLPQNGFTQFAARLFERRCPQSSNVDGFTRRKDDADLSRASDLSTDDRDDRIYRDEQRDPRSED